MKFRTNDYVITACIVTTNLNSDVAARRLTHSDVAARRLNVPGSALQQSKQSNQNVKWKEKGAKTNVLRTHTHTHTHRHHRHMQEITSINTHHYYSYDFQNPSEAL